MDIFDFYIRVIKALDEIGAPYMIVGAWRYGAQVVIVSIQTSEVCREVFKFGSLLRDFRSLFRLSTQV